MPSATTTRFGHGDRLQAGRQVSRLAEDDALLRRTLANQVADDDEPGGDAEPYRDRLRQVQRADRVDDRQARPHRALGIVLMRLRVAEIGKNPVAHILGEKPTKPGQHLGDRAIIRGDYLAQILGVEPGRQRGGADHVAEHDRQLTPLGLGCDVRRGRSRHVLRRGSPGTRRKIGDRFQQSPAMADRGHAKFFQIIGRQLWQDAQIDLVLAESLLVSLQPEPTQPASYVHSVVPAPVVAG